MPTAIFMGGAGICASLLLTNVYTSSSMSSFRFVHSETPLPASLDPLDSDNANNLHASQMVHRTLLEIGEGNALTSGVLSSFTYDPNTFQIAFKINPLARFSDGTSISSDDLAITIKRMAAKRPTFPVIRHINGIESWATKINPLAHRLEGLLVDEDGIRIQLARNVTNPLFRFALPLFGVVKASCVDLETNKLLESCPGSGYYQLERKEGMSLHFVVRSEFDDKRPVQMPDRIVLEYLDRPVGPKDLERMNEGSYVVLAQQYLMSPEEAKIQEKMKFSRVEQTNSRFSAFLLSPRGSAFATSNCRRVFAEALRANITLETESAQREHSLFARILPGFKSREELKDGHPITKSERAICLKRLEGQSIHWMPGRSNNVESFTKSLEKTVVELKMKLTVLPFTSPKDQFEGFTSGKTDLLLGGSGFWAFDPVGDVQMLLTKGLHKPLTFISGDTQVQSILQDLEFLSDPTDRLSQLNQYLYDQALMNVYSHSKRVYLTKGPGVSSSIPVAITPPAPWQIFNVQPD